MQVPTAKQAVEAGTVGAAGVCVRQLCVGVEVRESGFCQDCLDYLRGTV